jgi:DNA-directed RNA polymerase subunit RPC12/RpoP
MKKPAAAPEFRCLHCGAGVSCGHAVSAVRNRNHCPYCLWSRHLDWREPGDRLSSCKGAMHPVGLTRKAVRKKYGGANSGELMVVHECLECGSVSINRIAADDSADELFAVFRRTPEATARIRAGLPRMGIRVLGWDERRIVTRQLFGVDAAESFDSSMGRVSAGLSIVDSTEDFGYDYH